MNSLNFTTPVSVVQIFVKQQTFGREYRNGITRNESTQPWPEYVRSELGYVEEDQLFLPETVKHRRNLAQADTLLLIDYLSKDDHTEARPGELWGEQLRNGVADVDIFRLKRMGEEIWLSLLPGAALLLGYPERQPFDLRSLPPEQPVLVRINGKTWHSMTGRRQLAFHEWEYLFHYLGDFSAAHLKPELQVGHYKKTDPTAAATLNLRKIIY